MSWSFVADKIWNYIESDFIRRDQEGFAFRSCLEQSDEAIP